MHAQDDLPFNDLTCPINHTLFAEPMLAPCGHSFEKDSLDKLQGKADKSHTIDCPLCRKPFSAASAYPNSTLKNLIGEFVSQDWKRLVERHLTPKLLIEYISNQKIPSAILINLLENNPTFVNAALDANGLTSLHYAVVKNRTHLTNYLLHRGVSVDNPENKECPTALHVAAMHLEVTLETFKDLLAQPKLSVNLTYQGKTAIYMAAETGQVEKVAALIEREDTTVFAFSAEGKTPEDIAKENGHQAIVALFLAPKFGFKRIESYLSYGRHDEACALLMAHYAQEPQAFFDFIKKIVLEPFLVKLYKVFFLAAAEAQNIEAIKQFVAISPEVKDVCIDQDGNTTLHWACRTGRDDLVRHLLQCGADPNTLNGEARRRSAIQLAAFNQHWQCIDSFIELSGSRLRERYYSSVLLHVSSARNLSDESRADLIQKLVDCGAQLEHFYSDTGYTALHCCLVRNDVKSAEILLSKLGYTPELNRITPLHAIVMKKNATLDTLRFALMRPEFDINAKYFGCSPLVCAVGSGKANKVAILLEHPETDVFEICKAGRSEAVSSSDEESDEQPILCTAEDIAKENGDDAVVALFQNPKLLPKRLESLLRYENYDELCERLMKFYPLELKTLFEHLNSLKKHINFVSFCDIFYPIFFRATFPRDDHQAISAFLEIAPGVRNVRVNAQGDTALHVACRGGHDSWVEILLTHNADVSLAILNNRIKPIVAAASATQWRCVELIITRVGARAHSADYNEALLLTSRIASQAWRAKLIPLLIPLCKNEGLRRFQSAEYTPLHWVLVRNDITSAKLFIESGFDINTPGSAETLTPLHAIIKEPEATLETLRFVLALPGVAVNCRFENKTPLFMAAEVGQTDKLLVLLEHKTIDIHATANGMSAMEIAAKNKHLNCFMALAKRDVNGIVHTRSPLYIAAEYHYPEAIIELLKAKDINVMMRCENQQTALDIAADDCRRLITCYLDCKQVMEGSLMATYFDDWRQYDQRLMATLTEILNCKFTPAHVARATFVVHQIQLLLNGNKDALLQELITADLISTEGQQAIQGKLNCLFDVVRGCNTLDEETKSSWLENIRSKAFNIFKVQLSDKSREIKISALTWARQQTIFCQHRNEGLRAIGRTSAIIEIDKLLKTVGK